MMTKDSQIKQMIKLMKQKKVANHELMRMYIANHTARISDIRAMGYTVSKQRLYDSNGKATGTYEYWIPRTRKPKKVGTPVDNMSYEEVESKSPWSLKNLKKLVTKA